MTDMQNIEIQRSLRNILLGNRVGFDPSDADKEALKLLDDNSGSFAVEYAKNTPDVDPRVKQAMESIPTVFSTNNIAPVQQSTTKDPMIKMENGGILGGDLPPEAIANGNVIQGAPVGEVAVPGGGGPTDDGVPTELPEGTFVLNAASLEYHGKKNINDLIKKGIRSLVKKGVQISGEDLDPDDDVPVAISNFEYIIPPEVAKEIGIKKLEDMNERGLEYRKKQEETQKQQAAAQQEAMNSFVGAPIQSEQQMPMQDGGEATPPELTETERKILEFERLKQEYFARKDREEEEEFRRRRQENQALKDKEMGVERGPDRFGENTTNLSAAGDIVSVGIADGGIVPMQDGGEATPPDEAMLQVPEEDTPMFNQEQRDILLDSLLQEKLKDFLDQSREKNIKQEQKQLQELKEKGMIPNPETGGMDLMAEALKVPLISPKNLPLGSRLPERDVGDSKKPYEPVPMTFAAIGGQILPQVQSTLAGAGIGANAYPSSPQETFLNTPITGSVLQNLGNAVPFSTMQQPQQQVGFMQQSMDQKKSFEPDRLGFAKGTPKPLLKPTIFFEPIESLTAEQLGKFIQEAEVGAFPNPYIFTYVDKINKEGKVSTAFGPMQMTKGLLEDYIKRGILPKDSIDYAEKLMQQGVQRSRLIRQGKIKGTPYQGGGKGVISEEEHLREYPKIQKAHIDYLIKNSKTIGDAIKRHYGGSPPTNFTQKIQKQYLELQDIPKQSIMDSPATETPSDVNIQIPESKPLTRTATGREIPEGDSNFKSMYKNIMDTLDKFRGK